MHEPNREVLRASRISPKIGRKGSTVENTTDSVSVLIPVEGKEAHVPFAPTGTEWDRLAIAWCILAIPAMSAGKKPVAMPDRYLAKTMAQLPKDPNELRPKANAWAAQTRSKTHGKVALHAMLRMLLGNQVQEGLLWVEHPEGAVDVRVRQTAQLLLGHSTDHDSEFCAACKAIRHYDWPLAVRMAGREDAPLILGALIELYRSALQAGLVPVVYAAADGIERRSEAVLSSPPYRPEDIF